MKNSFGSAVSVTLFGESHGSSIGCVIDGLAPGVPIDVQYISRLLKKRRSVDEISTSRREEDTVIIESGVFNNVTTGTPVCIRIPNTDIHSEDYNRSVIRPGHADYAAECKFHGYQDYRGGGHFSGRVTAALVAAAGIVIPALQKKCIHIGAHILRLGGVEDRSFKQCDEDISILRETDFPVLDDKVADKMMEAIAAAKAEGDSIGGILETAVIGLPAGLGEPWFDTIEGMLSHTLFSIPAIKGVEFGSGFAMSDMRGSEANDAWRMGANGPITVTNHNGGINGGVTNGMPLLFRCAVKPTPSIAKQQDTISLSEAADCTISIDGRHDPCIVHRAAVVVEAITALTLCDLLATRYGTDWLGET